MLSLRSVVVFVACAWAASATEGIGATLLWEADLSKAGCQVRIGNSFSSTRRVVISGTRVVAVCDGIVRQGDGGRLMQTARVIALNLRDGKISGIHQVEAWVAELSLFGTATGQVIFMNGPDASVLNSDLTETGVRRKIDGRGINHISPDGMVVGYEHDGGVELLDSRSLVPTGAEFPIGVADTITARSVATRDIETPAEKPDFRYGKITTQTTSEPLYSGGCGQRLLPQYLRDDRMLLTCGNSFQVQDGTHVFFRERFFSKNVMFGGVSRNGNASPSRSLEGCPWIPGS